MSESTSIDEKGAQDQPNMDRDPELDAMRIVYAALKDLGPDAQNRVLDYVLRRLGLIRREVGDAGGSQLTEEPSSRLPIGKGQDEAPTIDSDGPDELEGVSLIAKKWLRRNGLAPGQLSPIFSLGAEEIDLIARGVNGRSSKDKLRSVVLLQGVAGYLGGGAARITDQKLREVASHYDAYDRPNFARYMKELAPEVTGTKEGGYTLTNRGLAAAAELIKGMSKGSG